MKGMLLVAAFSAYDWVMLGVGFAFTAFCFRMLPRIWRGEVAGIETRHSAAISRGYARAYPSGLAIFVIGLCAVPLLKLVPEQPEGPFARPYWAVLPFLAAFGLAAAAMGGTVFLNRPKFLVPPYLRDQPGALAEWIAGWRRGRRRARERVIEGRSAVTSGQRRREDGLDYPEDVSLGMLGREIEGGESGPERWTGGLDQDRGPREPERVTDRERPRDQEGQPPRARERRSDTSPDRAR